MNKKAILLLAIIMISLPIRAQAVADPADLLLRANEAYLKGDYPSAQDYYRKVLDSGIGNGKVYYNLGNTLFRMGKKGEAIRNYHLAHKLTPRHKDLEANLAYARHEIEDRMESPSSGALWRIIFWYDYLSMKEMAEIFLVCHFLFWSGLAMRLFLHRPAIHWLILFSLGMGIVIGGSAALRTISDYLHKPAVVIVQQVAVQSGMDSASATLFVLHDGAEVSVERASGNWSLISLASGKKGWVKKEQIGLAVF